MRRIVFGMLMFGAAVSAAQSGPAKPFTLREILSAPYALGLTASPVGAEFAWIENAEGVRNVWVGGRSETARMITLYSEDDAQDINGLTWSPVGDAVAYAYGAETGANGKPANPAHLQRATVVEVWVQPVSGDGKGVDLGEGRSPLFSHDGKSVMFVRSGEIWMAEVAGGASSARRLVVDRGSAGGLSLSPDGKLLAYVSRRGGHSFIGVFDLEAKTLRFVAPSTGRDFAPSFSSDGMRIAWLRGPFTEAAEFAANRVSAEPWSVMVADVLRPEVAKAVFTAVANKPGSVLPHMATGEPRVWWTGDGRLVFASEMDGWVHLYAVGADGGQAELLTPGKGEVEDVAVGKDGTLVWASNVPVCAGGVCDLKDEDRRHVWRWDGGRALAVTSGDGVEVRPQVCADGSIAVLASDALVPMHPAMVAAGGVVASVRKGEWPAGFPMAAVVKPIQVLMPEGMSRRGRRNSGVSSLRFASVKMTGVEEGRALHGQLFLPADRESAREKKADPLVSPQNDETKEGKDRRSSKHPALIFFHGGPMREMLLGYPAMEYYSNAYAMNQYLASRGFVVLSVNYHCGIGYGTEFRQCVHAGADGASEYADVLAAATYLRSRKDVDAKRIGVWGGSYGGYLTALALARNSDMFAAGVDFHGVHDWILEDNNADWLRGSVAEKDAIAKVAHASSPMADIAKWRSPILLIHGDNDANVAYNQTPVLADALRARGVHVEELIFPDEIHEFLLHKDWLKAYEAEAQFFERVLGGQGVVSKE